MKKQNHIQTGEEMKFYDFHPRGPQIAEVVTQFLEELLLVLGNHSEYILIISDENGKITDIFGDQDEIKKAGKLGLQKGNSLDKKYAGSNAVSVALREERPVQITGDEHELKKFHILSCTAAPIVDANGRILGSICLTAPASQAHPHTIGLISATTRAIETRLHNTEIQQSLYDAQQYAFSIMNELSFGLIAIDSESKIHWVNDTTCRSINIRRLNLVDREISQILPEWDVIKKSIDKGEKIIDHETGLNLKNHIEKYIINAYSVQNLFKDNIGYVVTMRPLSRVLKLINKYGGPQAHFTLDRIISKGKKMKKLLEYARAVASTPSTILITGESGTGKEVFAQAIHNASDRRQSGFVPINCGAISSSLIESELFGYEEGAFTGALKGGRPGKIEIAHQGTLFLDEIGEMPMDMQVKLLRVLQEKTISRVGSNKEIKVDIRVIAATNKDLQKEVEDGNFRQDLYYRLNVIPLEIPPLRERKMDIPPFLRSFLTDKASKLGRPVPEIDSSALKQIVNYPWPGNVRELENFAEKLVILEGNVNISGLTGEMNEQKSTEEKEGLLNFGNHNELPDLADLEKQIIIKYLEIKDNNISQTAKALGIGRNTLYQKLQKYKIDF